MAWIRNAWNNFKAQPEIWFFYGFILTSFLSIRKVFFDYPILGKFNEYSGIYLYLSDVFLALTIGTWVISILYNETIYLSKSTFSIPRYPGNAKLFHMKQFSFLRSETFFILLIPLVLVSWSFLSIKWSDNASIALYRSLKLFEFYLLYLFLALRVSYSTPVRMFHVEHPTGQAWNILRNAFRIIIAIGLINTVIGIFQFILQHSLGLFWLKESLLSPDLPGVAKIVLGSAKYIRAYGLFPHPNILGGFLLLSIILTLAYWGLFHVKQSKPACATRCASWDNGQCKVYSAQNSFSANHNCSTWNNYGRHNHYIFALILGIQIVAGILTFSKSAILGLILALVYFFYHWNAKMFHPSANVPPQYECSTWNILRGRRGTFCGASMEQFSFLRGGTLLEWIQRSYKKIGLLVLAIILGIIIINPDWGSLFVQTTKERITYLAISYNIISENLLAGIGSGQFVLEMQKYSLQVLQDWQLQPVHNVFLLIWTELGLVGLSLFSWLIWKLFHFSTAVPRLPRETKMFPVEHFSFFRGGILERSQELQIVFKALLIGFFVITLFDHYLWDIQQGQIMLWLALGFLASTNIRNSLTKK